MGLFIMSLELIESQFNAIQMDDYDRFMDQIIDLCDVINAYDGDTESIWYLGEEGEYTLDALLVGAYWHFSEWHAGQSSVSYAALSAVGSIFSPNMSSGPDSGTSEEYVYQELESLAAVSSIDGAIS